MTTVQSPVPQSANSTHTHLAAELRSAYENGARIKDLAVASHRAQSEVRRLLRESGAVVGGSSARPKRASAVLPAVPALQEEPRSRLPHPELGVLIGASEAEPHGTAGAAAPAEPCRVAARVVRVGEGTCFVVLSQWRPAIAVPVATSVLLAATGQSYERLIGAELTVQIRPDALHDRELGARDWQPADRRDS